MSYRLLLVGLIVLAGFLPLASSDCPDDIPYCVSNCAGVNTLRAILHSPSSPRVLKYVLEKELKSRKCTVDTVPDIR